jgi:3-oxoacyl-[acyl-carrier-protein] synthase-3
VANKLYSRIAGTGSYLPEKILTNKDLETMVDTTDEWIFTRTGIRERHLAAEGEFTSDMALEAAKNAIISAGITVSDIALCMRWQRQIILLRQVLRNAH